LRLIEIRQAQGIDSLELCERETPRPGPGQALVRVRACALNYRDYMIAKGGPGRIVKMPLVPLSDGAGEIVELGAGAGPWKVGDRVAGCFFADWGDGEITADAMASARGGAIDGMLAEYVAAPANSLVAVPAHLSFAEAATLPCAALTAWHALIEKGGLKPGETVLALGTGGVSIFALQVAKLAGARVILTSRSGAKLARAAALGADELIDTSKTPDWETEARRLTDGRGVDHVVEVGGPGTFARSIKAARLGGHIALIGVLAQGAQIDPTPIMRASLRVHGIYVGSRAMFERMNRAIAAAELKPVIDKRFAMAETRAAYRYMEAAGHFGKIVVEL
jgi:NADPH:quinone reductase-like Zn-dependent oxidoreductase